MEKDKILKKYEGILLGEIAYIRKGKSEDDNNLYTNDFLDIKSASERFFEVMYYETLLNEEGKKFILEYFGFDKIVEMAYEASKQYKSVAYDKENIKQQLKTFLS